MLVCWTGAVADARDQTRALSNQIRALADHTRALSNQTRALSVQSGAVADARDGARHRTPLRQAQRNRANRPATLRVSRQRMPYYMVFNIYECYLNIPLLFKLYCHSRHHSHTPSPTHSQERTRLVACQHVSNVLGCVAPIAGIVVLAHYYTTLPQYCCTIASTILHYNTNPNIKP
jgi:hypothetical protein